MLSYESIYFRENISSTLTLKKSASLSARSTEGVYFPFSIEIMVWRDTPTAAASSSWVMLFRIRISLMIFDIMGALWHMIRTTATIGPAKM